MPTNRTPISRPHRSRFTAETLALFAELNSVPPRQRKTAFRNGEEELAERLGLDPCWLSGNSVLDRSRRPCWPPHCVAHQEWFRVRAVREALLEALRSRHGPPGLADARWGRDE